MVQIYIDISFLFLQIPVNLYSGWRLFGQCQIDCICLFFNNEYV